MRSQWGRWSVLAGVVGCIVVAGLAHADGPRGAHFGGHFGGGGRGAAPAHFGGAAHFGGGAHFAPAPHYAPAPRYAPGPRYAPAPHYGAPAGRGAARFAPPISRIYPNARHGNWNRTGDEGHWDGDRGDWGGYGDWHGGGGWGDDDGHDWVGTYWGGGYWGGSYWPAVTYGVGFSWFLPVLPSVYATYWYDGIPYYYADDVYYTFDPNYDGYVATDPPPVGGYDASAQGTTGQIFMYPKNGQSPAQQAEDRRACEDWAHQQVGPNGNTDDFRRAMTACAVGRGYTVR